MAADVPRLPTADPRSPVELELERTRAVLIEAQKIARLGSFEYMVATRTTVWSEEEYRIYGLDPAKPSPEYAVMLEECIHPEDRDLLNETFTRAMQGNAVYELEHRIVCSDGTVKWVYDRAHPYFDDQGCLVRYIGTTLDITERKSSELKLLELTRAAESANRAKSAFLANMSHELRTPMNGIMGLTSLALERATDPRQHELLTKSMGAARHLLAIINDILDLSKIEADQLTLRYQDFSIVQVFEDSAQLVAEAAHANGLQIEQTIDPTVPARLHGDSVRLMQILVNYLSNAVKFSERGRIGMHARCVSDDALGVMLRLEVRDQGMGLSPAQQAKLFQPFVQGDSSDTRVHGGTGLGLSISRRLAQLMDGTVGVISEEGMGSTFWATVRLDRGSATEPQSQGDDPLQVLRRDHVGTTVLVVDDNPVNREVTSAMLASAGLKVDLAKNGRECVDLAASGAYALILMDIQMPEKSGIEATVVLRELMDSKELPIIAMTASAFEDERAACLAAGMNGVLLKPAEPTVLYAKVLKWLSRRRT